MQRLEGLEGTVPRKEIEAAESEVASLRGRIAAIGAGLSGRDALVAYLDRMEDAGVAHVLMNVVRGPRPAREVVEELGREVLPRLQGHARTPAA